ncbi:interleukin-2 [Erinaceus europaeus]|uniref:Interleukin-2 n=1 Tax=Erinaceus europaeus TaxID=9365 RepID=A0A1S3AKL6_ERIEU|nr:interleukin-2 [Erinaceus europaeus]
MCKVQLLVCSVLALALLACSVPTARLARDSEQHLEQLLLDLKKLKLGVENHKGSTLATMLRFPFYLPKEATELKHFQCLVGELKPLGEVLSLAECRHISELMSNINATVLELKGSGPTLPCDYEEEAVSVLQLLAKWISICQSIYSRLT